MLNTPTPLTHTPKPTNRFVQLTEAALHGSASLADDALLGVLRELDALELLVRLFCLLRCRVRCV